MVKKINLILFPKLPNGNVVWTCDNCGREGIITSPTSAVAIYCECDHKVHPECNDEWYNEGHYLKGKKKDYA